MTHALLRAWIPVVSLGLVVGAYGLSALAGHAVPLAMGKLLVFLLPLLWLGRIGPGRFASRAAWWWCALAIVGLAWLALVQGLDPAAIDAGWWRWSGRCLALVAAIVVATSGVAVGGQMRWFGATAAVVAVVALVAGLFQGDFGALQCFGLGHINILVNTVGPALWCWLALTLCAWRDGRPPGWMERILLPLGVGALGAFIVFGHRRGAALAAVLVLAWSGWAWAFRRWPRAALVGALLAAACACVPVWQLFQSDGAHTEPWERVLIYRAAVEGMALHPLWGCGELPALQLGGFQTENAAHLVAYGFKAANMHNEFLDVGLAGGLPALAILGALVVALARRTWLIREPALAAGLQAAGVAIAVHLLTDNAFSFETVMIYSGAYAGMVLAAPAAGDLPAPAWVPPAWQFTTPLVLVCAINSASAWPMAFLGKDVRDDLVACEMASRDPEEVVFCSTLLLSSSDPLHLSQRSRVLADAVAKLGWTDKLAFHAMKSCAEGGEPDGLVAATVRYLRLKPFNAGAWRLLHQALSQRPALSRDLPVATLRRLSWINDRPQAPVPVLAGPTRMEEAIDLFAALHWCLAHGGDQPGIDEAERELDRRYGDVQGVAELHALVAARRAAAATAPAGAGPR